MDWNEARKIVCDKILIEEISSLKIALSLKLEQYETVKYR